MRDPKILLTAEEMPRQWYNINPDLPKPLSPPLNPQTGEITAFPQYLALDDSLSGVPVTSIDQDASVVLWMGTAGGGLVRFDPQTELFTQYKHNPEDSTSLADNFVWNIYFDRSNNLWIGTAVGLDQFDVPK